MLEITSIHLQPMIAAEGNTAIGWLLVALFVLFGRWGWIVALICGVVVWKLRKSKSTLCALVVAVVFPVGIVMLVISTTYYAMPNRRTKMPPVEVRPALPTQR